jgi:hypothetical protein
MKLMMPTTPSTATASMICRANGQGAKIGDEIHESGLPVSGRIVGMVNIWPKIINGSFTRSLV